ncbi:MAG: 4-(cytidine 5'-diphospho)-2-C-methyl-D-erythritol kinase [Crocinitomicaceae bacterium]|nr:4-(cytidine 5'-diphospho)-2-C-methyl-D-erythritol kinase [Crocinitomicaceae bacterium]MDG2464321.1 4-(cytidine 5'-diphospho)-2-C-methyl-D-erythritol kinase [Crocinitomicaceae bacterium]
MIIFANAKINLGLFIHKKRNDGYHEISSLKFPIPLCDVIEILPSDHFVLKVLGAKIEGRMHDNLIYKAYSILKEKHNIAPVRIVLQKNIPIGAGIGGGSADATFTLIGLNDYFKLNLLKETLKEYADQLGSDCPFFVENKPQLASGKGDELLEFDLSLKGKFLYLIHPNIHISTAEAYAKVDPLPSSFEWISLKQKDFMFWKENLLNDFEKSIFPNHPEIDKVKLELYKNGAQYASMSGSGSSVFGIFDERPKELFPEFKSQFILAL